MRYMAAPVILFKQRKRSTACCVFLKIAASQTALIERLVQQLDQAQFN
jgi:hypothetical protein